MIFSAHFRKLSAWAAAGAWLAAAAPLAMAYDNSPQAETIRKVGIDQKLGDTLPLDLAFKDEYGRDVKLGDYFGRKPVILTPVYYTCPMLCHLVLNGLVKSLKVLKFVPGKDFEIVSFSFQPSDTTAQAMAKKEAVLKDLGHPDAGRGWHFLTGDAETIRTLTQAIGFRYAYDPRAREFAHASGIMVLTPEGTLSRYFFGIDYSPRDLRLALIESASHKIGTLMDQLILLCYHYDPSSGKYGFAVMNFLRLSGTLLVLALAFFITRSLRRERTVRETL